ncbi:MFS general substrate transporter [Gloeophyllum trabeum ATCC 11539]|uniref:MFS general substrate transporter n=1 Tax=Gloeophyllum trabeum (strain ATCC 11539 / FP-39264 / Madison 617) TaxID=670483 RepID=S7RKY0_GLOTA|nr:MFS general substrate transporter [Gloeophyllum trabeum ATCC 11539]EPQ53334.1 MFS general substrate transporter [Gloeophyllum trabeum ATCC 11539]
MALGVLEDRHLEHVPGTARLEELKHNKYGVPIAAATNLKKGTGRDSHVILVPQPSDDPRDPLNWPTWKKEILFWSICYMAGLVGACGPLLAPGYATIALEWGVSTNDVAASNGDLVIALGCIMMVMAPFAVKFGRRPVFLLSALLLFTCSIWSAVSNSLQSFVASRVFQGFGMASFEALVTATIGDIYFVHQRGFRVAVWGLAILGGINVAPIVNGYMIESKSLGWRWCFWIITIFFGIALAAVILFVPETNYDRRAEGATETATPASEKVENVGDTEKEYVEHIPSVEQAPKGNHLPPKTFVQELAPWSGYVSKVSFLQVFFRPFPFLLSPIIWFAIFSYGLTTCWLVVLSVISSVVFSAPPYNFDASQTGLVSIGPLVAGIITAFLAGPLCDYSATWFAKRNNGIYEPESRLYIMFFMLILEVVGFAGWAAMQSAGVHWIGPVIMYSLINAGQGIGSTAIVTYVIDVHTKHSPECFALINFIKNVILYGFTQFSVAWVTKMGILHTFGILAGLAAFCILTTIPMYVYGKRARSWVARHPQIFDRQ